MSLQPSPLVGPHFSTFTPNQVRWLLSDYSQIELERPTIEREPLIQSGARHYAEDLPIEVLPDADYMELVDRLMLDCAEDVAAAVHTVADQISAARPHGVVLVSLVRAGVPAGIWIQEALQLRHRMDAAHYAISLVKGFGLDPRALDYLMTHEDVSQVMFIDGWTGKGAILRELTEYLAQRRTTYGAFPSDLAVLADPGGYACMAGTREDLLIPTATLNSTSCGLISRTVLPHPTAPPGSFHGAKYYREFSQWDRSQQAIQSVATTLSDLKASTRPAVDRQRVDFAALANRLGTHPRLIKPGIGETTRVLQRRVPDRIAIHPDHVTSPRLAHIHLLAQKGDVPIVIQDTSPYTCVGLIRPLVQLTR